MVENKPTLDSIKQSYIKTIERYRNLRSIQTEHLEYYECKYGKRTGQVVNLGIVHQVLPPIAQEMIDPGVNMLALDSIVVHCPPAQKAPKGTETEKAKSEADTKEKWLQTLVNDLAHIQPYAIEQAAFFYNLFGEAYLHTAFDWEFNKLNTETGERQDYSGNPFEVLAPDPTSIYASFNLDKYSRPAWLFQKKVMLAGEARELLTDWLGKRFRDLWGKGVKDSDQVFWVEWWMRSWKGVITGVEEHDIKNWALVPLTSQGEIIVPNRLGFVPFTRLLGGKGFFAIDDEPERVVRGALRGYETQIVQLAREMSKVDTLSSYFAGPNPHITFENEEAQRVFNTGAAPTFGPGVMIQDVKGQYTLVWDRPPNIPDSIMANISQIKATLERGFPGIVSGQVSPGEPAASSLTRLSQATLRWEPLKRSISQGIANFCSMILEIVDKHIEGGIELNGLELAQAIIKGLYRVEISLKSNNPAEKNMQKLIALQLWDKLPRRMLFEEMGYENASQIEIDMAAQRIIDTSPLVRRAIDTEAARLIGLNIQIENMPEEGPISTGGEMAPGSEMPTVGEQVPGIGGSPELGVPPLSPELIAQNRQTRPMRRVAAAVEGGP